MDKQSKLIFEAYQSLEELVDLVEFTRNVSNTNSKTRFDAFVFKDKNTKKKYTLHQIVMREDGGEPEIFGTTIFDNARDADVDGMIFHTIDKNVHLHGLGDLRKDSSINHNHKFFDEDKLGWEKVREMIHKAFAMTEKQRRVKEYGMKPETEKTFKDILTNLSEEVENDERFEIKKVKLKQALGGDQDVYTYDILDKLIKTTYRVYSSFDIAVGDRENEIYLLEPHLKGTGTHGQLKHTGQSLLATTYGDDFASELKSIPIYKGARSKGVKSLFELGKFLNNIDENYLKQLYFTQALKPKTREHFGDIMIGLSENSKAVPAGKFPKVNIMGLWRDEDEYHQGTDEILFKVSNKYYLTREFYEEVPNVLVGIYYFADTKFAKQKDGTLKITNEGEGFFDFMGDRNRLKKWNDRSRQDVINFQHDPKEFALKSYKHGVTSIDPDVVAINDFLLKFTERERQVYMLKIKPKTAEHFGDIMGGLS